MLTSDNAFQGIASQLWQPNAAVTAPGERDGQYLRLSASPNVVRSLQPGLARPLARPVSRQFANIRGY
jgi:hypothetical protein